MLALLHVHSLLRADMAGLKLWCRWSGLPSLLCCCFCCLDVNMCSKCSVPFTGFTTCRFVASTAIVWVWWTYVAYRAWNRSWRVIQLLCELASYESSKISSLMLWTSSAVCCGYHPFSCVSKSHLKTFQPRCSGQPSSFRLEKRACLCNILFTITVGSFTVLLENFSP